MHRKTKNLIENHTTSVVSEIYTKQSINEENSSLSMNNIGRKAKKKGGNLKSERSQTYSQKPDPPKFYFHEFHLSTTCVILTSLLCPSYPPPPSFSPSSMKEEYEEYEQCELNSEHPTLLYCIPHPSTMEPNVMLLYLHQTMYSFLIR
jgi:hypothetical protein